MADDSSYANFLDKANLDPNITEQSSTSASTKHDPSTSTSQTRSSRFDPTTSNAGLPPALSDLSSLSTTPYTSDTDADWEPVFLNYASDEAPDVDAFARVVLRQQQQQQQRQGDENRKEQADVQELSLDDFDPRGTYAEVVRLVRRAGREDRAKEVRGGRGGGGSGGGGDDDDGDDGEVKVFRVQVSATRVEYFVVTVGERKLLGLVAAAVES